MIKVALKEFTLATDKGGGWEKVIQGQFYDRNTVCKEEIFTAFD